MQTKLIEKGLKYNLPIISIINRSFLLHSGNLILYDHTEEQDQKSLKLDEELIADLNSYLDERQEQVN